MECNMRGIQCICCITACYLFSAGLYGQQKITIQGMSFTYSIEKEALRCTLQAKTNGWVGVGFNSKNSIVGSDLLLFNIVNDQASGVDLYVKSAGNPKNDDKIGGKSTFKILQAKEIDDTTMVQFTIPLNSSDPYDFIHKVGEQYWIILAYSVSDDFGHHSRVRKHLPFTLEGVH